VLISPTALPSDSKASQLNISSLFLLIAVQASVEKNAASLKTLTDLKIGELAARVKALELAVILQPSCKDILDAGLAAGSKMYRIKPKNYPDPAGIDVYCDMCVEWAVLAIFRQAAFCFSLAFASFFSSSC
jgi:hypothetical protein